MSLGQPDNVSSPQNDQLWPVLGLQNGRSPEELVFALPGMRDDELNYTIDAAKAIRSTEKATLKLAKKAISFVPGFSSGVKLLDMYDVVDGVDLFDAATAHILDTVGDADTKAAATALREAMAEPSAEGKRDHRNRAATHLESAYDTYDQAVQVIQQEAAAMNPDHRTGIRKILSSPDWRPMARKACQAIDLRAKAASRAIALSLVNRQMGLQGASIGRAETALTHIIEQGFLRIARARLTFLLGNVALEGTGSLDISEAGGLEEWCANIDRTVQTANAHVANARSWDRSRIKAAEWPIDLEKLWTEPRLVEARGKVTLHNDNLGYIQRAADDLAALKTTSLSFLELYAALTEE